jgi:hypothetical protein
MSGERPTNVRVVKSDGTVIPCELAYQGINDQGCHEWSIATEVNLREGDKLLVEMLPGHTSITMPTRDYTS